MFKANFRRLSSVAYVPVVPVIVNVAAHTQCGTARSIRYFSCKFRTVVQIMAKDKN